MPATAFGGGVECQSERSGCAALLADDVPQVVGMNPQLELRVVTGTHDLGAHVVGVVDDAARHVQDQIAEMEIVGIGIPTRRRDRGRSVRGVDDVPGFTDRPVFFDRADESRVARARSRLAAPGLLFERAAPAGRLGVLVFGAHRSLWPGSIVGPSDAQTSRGVDGQPRNGNAARLYTDARRSAASRWAQEAWDPCTLSGMGRCSPWTWPLPLARPLAWT